MNIDVEGVFGNRNEMDLPERAHKALKDLGEIQPGAALGLCCRLLGCHLLAHPLYCADAYAKLAGRAYNAFPIR